MIHRKYIWKGPGIKIKRQDVDNSEKNNRGIDDPSTPMPLKYLITKKIFFIFSTFHNAIC